MMWIRRTLVLLALGLAACSGSDGPGSSGGHGAGEVLRGELSAAEVDSLSFMREEEKLARDVYIALDGFGQPFTNIKNSEQSHMDAIGSLLDRYDLKDPTLGQPNGAFLNVQLQELYDDLVSRGLASNVSALAVGCEIEELDIRDIEAAKAEIDNEDIVVVYDNLLLGSRNHLRAFYGKLIASGGTYTPKYIDPSVFDGIVASPKEKPKLAGGG